MIPNPYLQSVLSWPSASEQERYDRTQEYIGMVQASAADRLRTHRRLCAEQQRIEAAAAMAGGGLGELARLQRLDEEHAGLVLQSKTLCAEMGHLEALERTIMGVEGFNLGLLQIEELSAAQGGVISLPALGGLRSSPAGQDMAMRCRADVDTVSIFTNDLSILQEAQMVGELDAW